MSRYKINEVMVNERDFITITVDITLDSGKVVPKTYRTFWPQYSRRFRNEPMPEYRLVVGDSVVLIRMADVMDGLEDAFAFPSAGEPKIMRYLRQGIEMEAKRLQCEEDGGSMVLVEGIL